MSVLPEAYFDVATLLNSLKRSLLPMPIIEAHLLSYIACVIALWNGKAISDWGYSFALTSEGFPFSTKFDEARSVLISSGHIMLDDNGDMVPQPSLPEVLSSMFFDDRWNIRRSYIEAAAKSALSFPSGSIRYAIAQSPGFGSAFELGQNSELLNEYDIEDIYEEYSVIMSTLHGKDVDLLSPAVIWLSARILGSYGDKNDL